MTDAGSRTADKRVLVVDDQSTARAILREILLSLGYDVVEAADAETAVKLIDSEPFCLVTLDIILPRSSGLEVLRFARERFSYSELPVVVVSIKDESADIVEALSLGANDYVTKPINHEVLTARIQTHLSQWHHESELRRARDELETRVVARTADLELSNRALRKEIEERRRAESLHRATLESTVSGILVVSHDSAILSFNQRFLDMWQIPRERIEAFTENYQHAVEFVADQLLDPGAFVERLNEVHELEHESSVDILYFKDGRIFERQSNPYRLDGKVVGRVWNFQDITERLRAERQLEEYRNNLEELVSSRTAELEAVNNEIASFSYSVSHDLRAPLRSIDGFSKLMLEDYGEELDDNAHVYLGRIRNASQHMGELIDDVLLLSRLSRRELALQDVNLAAVAKEVFGKLEESEPDRSAEFVVPEDLPAKGDPHLLRILLENLIGNAWKYSRKRNDARIQLDTETDDNGTTVYYVRDNGVGFDMQYVEKLFQPFQRLHSVTEFEGTGIGLATVAQIVRRHGGEVRAEGKLNLGATVYFTLPRRHTGYSV